MTLKPLGQKVVLKLLEQKETTASGIVLPDSVNKEGSDQGEVIAVGPGKLLDNGQTAAISVKVGERVVFKKYSAEEFDGDGQKYLIISESDILAIIE